MPVNRGIFLGAALLLAGCGDGVADYATSAAGNSVFASEDFCSLRKQGSKGAMVIMLPKDAGEARFSFEAADVTVPDGDTADFGLVVTPIVGDTTTILQDRVEVITQRDVRIFGFSATPDALVKIRDSKSIMFMWGDAAANVVRQPQGYAEDFRILARCLGPAASRYAALTPSPAARRVNPGG